MSVDLRTRYLGLELRSPLVASPSPLTGELTSALALVEAGAAALILPSLFEEEILHEEIELNRSLEQGDEQFAEAPSYFPSIESFAGAGDRYIARLEQIRARATVPVIASLNANTAGGWVRYGRLIQDAGADALELTLRGCDSAWLNRYLVERGYPVSALVPRQRSLKEFFLSITGNGRHE